MGYSMFKTKQKQNLGLNKKISIWKDVGNWELLVLALPAIIGYALFHYTPLIIALVIPFKDYKFSQGVWGSEWVLWENFEWLIHSTSLFRVIRNTLSYSVWFMIILPTVNIIIALLLFEITSRRALKIFQTIITFPNFMSMVVVGYITYALLSPTSGWVNSIITFFGFEGVDAYMTPNWWPGILTLVNIWKGVGMGSMMYFASLMAIDPSLFEAAEIDGANRLHKALFISIPHLVPLICVFTILAAGSIFSGNFDLFYVIPRDVAVLYPTTDVLPTYIYRALTEGNYASGASVSLLQSIAGLIMVVLSNTLVKKISPENSMF